MWGVGCGLWGVLVVGHGNFLTDRFFNKKFNKKNDFNLLYFHREHQLLINYEAYSVPTYVGEVPVGPQGLPGRRRLLVLRQ